LTDEEKKKLLDGYREEVDWLRHRVPRDDIYEFAQQLRMSAEFFMGRLMMKTDVIEDAKTDNYLAMHVRNLTSLYAMQRDNYTGSINTEIQVIES